MNCACGKNIWARDHKLTPKCRQVCCDDCKHFQAMPGSKDRCDLNADGGAGGQVRWYTAACTKFTGRG